MPPDRVHDDGLPRADHGPNIAAGDLHGRSIVERTRAPAAAAVGWDPNSPLGSPTAATDAVAGATASTAGAVHRGHYCHDVSESRRSGSRRDSEPGWLFWVSAWLSIECLCVQEC